MTTARLLARNTKTGELEYIVIPVKVDQVVLKEAVDKALLQEGLVSVAHLEQYYYDKATIDQMIDDLDHAKMHIVDSLPVTDIQPNTIYLIKKALGNSYEQYIYVDGIWADLGSTDINLDNYYTKEEIDAKIVEAEDAHADYYNKAEIDEKLKTSGSAGFYAGTDEPQDENIVFWLDTSNRVTT